LLDVPQPLHPRMFQQVVQCPGRDINKPVYGVVYDFLLRNDNVVHQVILIFHKYTKISQARPIKDTPIISGENEKRFLEAMENVVPTSKEESEKQRKAYEWFKSRAKFPMP
jgi:hypothetical protein